MTDEETSTVEAAVNTALADLGEGVKAAPDPKVDPNRIVENHLLYLLRIIDKLRGNAAALEVEIAELSSRLRQTRASIEAFTLAAERLRP